MTEIIAEINRKLATLGYTADEISAVQPIIVATLSSNPDVVTGTEEDRRQAAEDVVLLLIDEMDGQAPPAGVTPPPPPPSGTITAGRVPTGTTSNVLGDIDDLLAGAPNLRATGTPAATPGLQSPGLIAGTGTAEPAKFSNRGRPYGGATWRAEQLENESADLLFEMAGHRDPFQPARDYVWNATGGFGGLIDSMSATRTGGTMDNAPVGAEPSAETGISFQQVVETLIQLAPLARQIWEARTVRPDRFPPVASFLQYVMTGNERVAALNRCNFVAKAFAKQYPDVARAIAEFQCGQAEPIGGTDRGRMIFMALKLHHAGIDFNSICDCGN